MVLSPTLTSKQPLRGFSALIVTLPPAALTAASIFAARVLNAPHDLHASMVTAPPPPPPPLLAGFFAMVFTGLEAGFDLLFGGIFAVEAGWARRARGRRWTEATIAEGRRDRDPDRGARSRTTRTMAQRPIGSLSSSSALTALLPPNIAGVIGYDEAERYATDEFESESVTNSSLGGDYLAAQQPARETDEFDQSSADDAPEAAPHVPDDAEFEDESSADASSLAGDYLAALQLEAAAETPRETEEALRRDDESGADDDPPDQEYLASLQREEDAAAELREAILKEEEAAATRRLSEAAWREAEEALRREPSRRRWDDAPAVTSLPAQSSPAAAPPPAPPRLASEELSMFATAAPLPKSPLALALAMTTTPTKPAPAKPAPTKKSASKVVDKPVTFHRKISSSGYGATPPLKLHSGGPTVQARRAAAAAASKPLGGAKGLAAHTRSYNSGEGPPLVAQAANCAALPPFLPLTRLAYAGDGSRIAAGASDGSIALLRLPARRYANAANGAPAALAAHGQTLTSLHFSHSGRLLLAASADGSASVWDVTADHPPPAPLLHLRHVRGSPPPFEQQSSSSSSPSSLELFGGEVRGARFFYLDRLILLAASNAVHLYSYSLTRNPADDTRRAAPLRHAYKLAHRWALPTAAQHATAVAAANAFLSPMVLAAGSDRSLAAFDAGTGQTVLEIAGAHERPVHTISLYDGGRGGGDAARGCELFVTAALDGAVKLWDLRAPRTAARTFAGAHANRVHAIGAALSPCLRYVGVGSEDRHAYLYDVRGGGVVGATDGAVRAVDAVVDVAFSPVHPQLATASLDGRVRFFADRE